MGILALAAYADWKEQEVPLRGLLLAGAGGFLLQLACGDTELADIVSGAAVGVLVLIAARVTGEAIGAGDGLILIVSGIFLGFWRVLWLFMTALFCSGAVALFLLVVKRKGRKYRLPFIPFLLAAYLLQLI